MGKPGAMLKIARMRFIRNSHSSTSDTGFSSDCPRTNQAAKQAPAISRLVNGPTIAMTNSCRGRRASPAICETPPKINRVMFFTGMPCRRAITLCASSCRTIEVKNARPLAMAMAQCKPVLSRLGDSGGMTSG